MDFLHPWRIVVTSPAWWGLGFATWGCSIQKCRALGPDGSDSICSRVFCLYRPSTYLARLMLRCLVSAWVLDPMGHLKEWSSPLAPTKALTSCRPFSHSFRLSSCLGLDEGHLVFVSSSTHPPGLLSRLRHSCISWFCIAFWPSSLGQFCKGRGETPSTITHRWRQWQGLCRRLRQLGGPLCLNELRMTLGSHLPATLCLVWPLRIFYDFIPWWSAWQSVHLTRWRWRQCSG